MTIIIREESRKKLYGLLYHIHPSLGNCHLRRSPAPKPHYAALDGLRGVAAVMVVLFHMFEGSARDLQFLSLIHI